MPELLGPYTGVPLNRMPKLSYMDKEGVPADAVRLALELQAAVYADDLSFLSDAGWVDIQSFYRNQDKNAPRIAPRRAGRPPENASAAGIEKALLLAHPGPDSRCLIAIVFRGTADTAEDWAFNFDLGPDDGFHRGFLALADDFFACADVMAFPEASRALGLPGLTLGDVHSALRGRDSRFKLFLTGYSQGGAVMQLYVHRLIGLGADRSNILGCAFAPPSVSFDRPALPREYYPLCHIINSDDVTPRVGARHHLGQKFVYQATAAMREACYEGWQADDELRRFILGFQNITDTQAAACFSIGMVRAALGLPRDDQEVFSEHFFGSTIMSSRLQSVLMRPAFALRLMLRNLLRDYRNVYGEPPKTGSEELDILSDILKVGPGRYPQLLWRALGAPHMLVQKNGSLPGAYQHIVVNGLDGLHRTA